MTRHLHIRIGRLAGIITLLVLVLEFRGAFTGPGAFVRKPTLVLSPIHAPYLEDEQIDEVRSRIEKELAGGGNHALYPKKLIENFYLERDNATDVFDGSYRGRTEAFELGKALGVERIAIASVQSYQGQVRIYIAVYDIATDQVVGRFQQDFSEYEDVLEWTDPDGLPVNLEEGIGDTVPGMSVGAWLYLGWLAVILLPALILLFGKNPPRGLVESLLGTGLLLSLFSWIYALNGDMDYVQRFVATSGALDIADTSAERAATIRRYLAPMLLMAAAWVLDIIRRFSLRRESGASLSAAVWVEATAGIWVGFSGLLYALSLPNFVVLEGLPLLAWMAVAPLFVVLRRVRFRRGISMMFFFTGLQALLVNWWQGTFSYVSLPFTVSLTLIQYVPFAIALAATLRFLPKTGFWAAPLLWTGFEWIRSLGFLGYPWGILGVSQYASPGLIQVAALGGVWVISALTFFASATVAIGMERLISGEVLPRGLSWKNFSRWLYPWRPALAVAGVVLITWAAGSAAMRSRDGRMAHPKSAPEGRRVRILLVQQNTDPRKHDYRLSFSELSRLTEEALNIEGSFDLVAWPESGFVPDIRFWLEEPRNKRRRGLLVQEFLDWQLETGISMVTGTQDHFYEDAPPSDDPEAPEEVKRIRNSAMYLAADRTDAMDRDYYYKIRLVPFTENFPYGEQFPWVAELLHNFSTTQWTPGTEHKVFDGRGFRFSTPICFEDVFPDHVRRYVAAGADVLVNMSNDYWANTPLEGYQHASHAVFRSVENRRPMVRATCSGWTISVDSSGRIAGGWPPFYTPGWTVGEHFIPDEQHLTFYTRFGDWFPVFCLTLWAILSAAELILVRHRGKRHSWSGW